MKSKIRVIAKLILSALLFLVWFFLIQGEYEMITKPELQNDFPIVKGVYAVYLTGFALLVIAAAIPLLLHSIKKSKTSTEIKAKSQQSGSN
ncbi:MAG TPA: hypothetical protein VJ553_05565 [Candidatus Paceibacterota bacterium]|nr:hypothetical protein [Candidatus Paceibacterota bacterium]